MRSCSLLAPSGGVILLKSPARRRGVGTNKVLRACEDRVVKKKKKEVNQE